MNRIAALLLTGWVLVGAPALCLAGVLGHPCACSDCRQGCETEKPKSCPQGHECQNDPCDTHVINHRTCRVADELVTMVQPEFLPATECEGLTLADDVVFAIPETALRAYPPSFADRGLPLLV